MFRFQTIYVLLLQIGKCRELRFFCLKLKHETSYGVSFFNELGFFSIFIPRRYWLLLFIFRLQQGIRYNFGIIGWRSTQAARMPLSPLSANKGSSSLLWMSKSSSTLTVRLDHGSQSLHISTIAFHIDHHWWQKYRWHFHWKLVWFGGLEKISSLSCFSFSGRAIMTDTLISRNLDAIYTTSRSNCRRKQDFRTFHGSGPEDNRRQI